MPRREDQENLQRMQNLGILNLARKLQSETRPGKRPFGNSNPAPKSTPPTAPSRRSSRLENTTPVTYNERDNVKGKKSKGESLLIFEGPRVEVYTEVHEKLLGNTERSWTCFVDGYGKDGKGFMIPSRAKLVTSAAEDKQKTLGHRTQCSVCDLVQGQFCGDCLFMRYGEHVLEALDNPESGFALFVAGFATAVCAGIIKDGFQLVRFIEGCIAKLGYKSVAHYLIQTKRAQSDEATPNQASAKRSLSFQEAKQLPDIADDDDLPNEVPELQIMKSQNGDSLKKEEDENTKDENPSSAKSEEAKTGVRRSERRASLEPNSESIGSSVITRSKRKAALEEPNPDSIGARLRQRRRSQSGL
ncbi:hypothetical protein HID58_094987 [Brassica napus]|uniref:Zinc-finger domain-containing protein n=1 Tax=Brassica napus TaxID=3708 RepID=A0ABQ7X592_BRANA|nr:hypothetical protein HID58_094987 [Brassica napus]